MPVTLEANYCKKVGLPGYSSHQFSLTVKVEISDLKQVHFPSPVNVCNAHRWSNHPRLPHSSAATSALLTQLSGPQSTLWKRAYEPFRAVLKSTSVERSGTTYARYQHTRDDLGRVTLRTGEICLYGP